MNFFTSFDEVLIAYRDQGGGPAVILLHGYGVDGLGQFGDYHGILLVLEKRQKMFTEVFGGAPPLPDPPSQGRAGVLPTLQAAGARTILPDMRGFGASGRPRGGSCLRGFSDGQGRDRSDSSPATRFG